MEKRALELKVISAQNLRKTKIFGRENCYVVVYVYSNDKKATRVDKNGGVNPTWNEKLNLSCDQSLLERGASYITVEIYSRGSCSDKLMGTSRISLVQIGNLAASEAPPKFLSFEVCRPSGKVKGVINLSVKLGEKTSTHSGETFSIFSDNHNRHELREASPSGYSQVYRPISSSPNGEIMTPYPPQTISYKGYAANAGTTWSSSGTNSSDANADEPVMAYPATGYPVAYPPQQYGNQYYGSQQYYYAYTQAPARQYEDVHYTKPPGRQTASSSSASSGMGLLGGLLGGLLLGDVISDIF